MFLGREGLLLVAGMACSCGRNGLFLWLESLTVAGMA